MRRRVRAQHRQRIVVAGVEREHVAAVVEGHGEGALQVGAQGFDLRGEPGLRLALGPEQLGAEFAELRRLALAPDDELAAQLVLPALERAPHMAVRQRQRPGGGGDGAVLCHGLQRVEQRVADERVARVAAERVVELDPMHEFSYRWTLMCCIR